MLGDRHQRLLLILLLVIFNTEIVLFLKILLISGDELKQYINYAFPNWSNRLISNGLEFNHKKLKVEGIPEVAKCCIAEVREGLTDDEFQELLKSGSELKELNSWMKLAFGDLDEYKVHMMLWQKFYKDPGLLINGFVENSLGKFLPLDVGSTMTDKV